MDNRVVVIIGILATTIIGLLVVRRVFFQKNTELEGSSSGFAQETSPDPVSSLSARS